MDWMLQMLNELSAQDPDTVEKGLKTILKEHPDLKREIIIRGYSHGLIGLEYAAFVLDISPTEMEETLRQRGQSAYIMNEYELRKLIRSIRMMHPRPDSD